MRTQEHGREDAGVLAEQESPTRSNLSILISPSPPKEGEGGTGTTFPERGNKNRHQAIKSLPALQKLRLA
jgi:hypothetical protein